MPKVSVVVPVYNVEKYIPKCVESILAQTERDFELILVDDGATDKSGEVCDSYAEKDDRVRVIHQENRGLGGARDTGIDAAKGEWILFVDSDDWIEPETLEKSLKAAESTGAQIAAFAFRSVDEHGRELQIFREDVQKNTALKISEHKEVFLVSPCAWNKLYKAELFKNTDIRYPTKIWYEDIPTTLKLYTVTRSIVFIDDVCYNYLQRAGSIIKSGNADRNVEIITVFDDILNYFKANGKFEEYKNELCYLTLFHVYLTASVRVLNIDTKHPLLKRFSQYLNESFPDWRENKYLPRLGKKRALLVRLLQMKLYSVIKLMFKLKGQA